MRLTKLWIVLREPYGKPPDYYGTAEFSGNTGKVELKVNDEQCRKIFDLCADGMVEVAKETAKLMRQEIIEHQEVRSLETRS